MYYVVVIIWNKRIFKFINARVYVIITWSDLFTFFFNFVRNMILSMVIWLNKWIRFIYTDYSKSKNEKIKPGCLSYFKKEVSKLILYFVSENEWIFTSASIWQSNKSKKKKKIRPLKKMWSCWYFSFFDSTLLITALQHYLVFQLWLFNELIRFYCQ